METNFELKNVTKKTTPEANSEYTLSFFTGEENKTITLQGTGELKEAVKI